MDLLPKRMPRHMPDRESMDYVPSMPEGFVNTTVGVVAGLGRIAYELLKESFGRAAKFGHKVVDELEKADGRRSH